ncbi:MAG: hypothetical protein RLZZ127_549 [Planctomycetota bacterium]|jgi:hypothetical protein
MSRAPAVAAALLLAAAAATVGLAHPGEAPWLAAIALGAGAAGIACPAGGWVLFTALAGLGLPLLALRWPLDDAALPWTAMVLAVAIAVPARAGSLHYLAAWAALVAIGAAVRTPAAALPVAAAAAVVAVGAIAVDARLAALRGAQGPARGRLLAAASAALALAAGLAPAAIGTPLLGPAGKPAVAIQGKGPGDGRGPRVSGLDDRLMIGQGGSISQDPQPAARLQWDPLDPPADAPAEGMAYLRARAFSRLLVEGGILRWAARPGEGAAPGGPPGPYSVLRLPGGGDAVLLPDGAAPHALERLVRDGEGSWFQPGLGRGMRTYVASAPAPLPSDAGQEADARILPPELAGMPWATIEDPAWAAATPRLAAAAIALRLADRCTYATDDLPESGAAAADGLRRFLFGDEGERRGHCQYFSTATAVLLRRAGHPARCVVGFASDEIGQGAVTFRGWHAHAWIEVAEAGRWWRVDPTPPAPRARDLASLRDLPDDPVTATAATTAALADAAASPAPWIAAAAAILVGALAVVWWRRRRPADAATVAARQALDLVRLAAQAGIRVRPGQSIDALAADLSRRTGIDLGPWRTAHLAARFGGGPTPKPWPLRTLAKALRPR